MLGLTPGNLIIQLRKLEDADYISSTKTRNGPAQKTTVALTGTGRAALSAYIQALRHLLGGLDVDATPPSNTAAASPGNAPQPRLPDLSVTPSTFSDLSPTPSTSPIGVNGVGDRLGS
jgi:Winged helix DNA-binding domain